MSGEARPFLSAQDIARAVSGLGASISRDHPRGVVVVGVLKGGAVLVADLVRAVSVPCVVDFLALSPYGAGKARARILKDLDVDVGGRDVVLVEGVVDTGLSAGYLVRLLTDRGATKVCVCTLLDRPGRRIVPLVPTYVGFEAPDAYLVGYGLDALDRYRNLSGIYALQGVEAPSGKGGGDLGGLVLEPGRLDVAFYGHGAS